MFVTGIKFNDDYFLEGDCFNYLNNSELITMGEVGGDGHILLKGVLSSLQHIVYYYIRDSEVIESDFFTRSGDISSFGYFEESVQLVF